MAVTDGSQLRALAAKLNAAGNGALKAQLRAGIRAAAQPLIGDVRAAAAAKLPHSGGLADQVSSEPITVSTLLAGRNVSVRLKTRNAKSPGGAAADFGTDRGEVRHPVYGRRKGKWAVTNVNPGWWSSTLEHSTPTVVPFVQAAMRAVAVQVTRL